MSSRAYARMARRFSRTTCLVLRSVEDFSYLGFEKPMCGIYLTISSAEPSAPNSKALERLQKRGPDAFDNHPTSFSIGDVFVEAYTSVLSLRGYSATPQPIIDSSGCLCWNGEAWVIDGQAPLDPGENDTNRIWALLSQAAKQDASPSRDTEEPSFLMRAVSRIRGPFAFVFVDRLNRRVVFARDILGRRSLLRRWHNGALVLASVGDDDIGWKEVGCDGVYVLDITSFPEDPIDTPNDVQDPLGCVTHYAYDRLKSGFRFNREVPAVRIEPSCQIASAVLNLEQLLRASIEVRLKTIPSRGSPTSSGVPTRMAILFSGGLDCTVLARLVNDLLPSDEPIDLLNVAFENPRVHKNIENELQKYEQCPDRITGRKSLQALKDACPGRLWRFVEINIPYSQTATHRPEVVGLLQPHDTEMDLSIGFALYFASRGIGKVLGFDSEFETQARVLISGLGADELFGGYGRHAAAFYRNVDEGRDHAFTALLDELELDFKRLGKRNLGRDDRIMSHWSREPRYPFLDENLVDWAVNQPFWTKCPFGFPLAISESGLGGDKHVLRLLAHKVGLPEVAKEKKRAIQFGARTAKMEKGRTKGTDAISSTAE